jgi:molecular chaperone IbpA
MSKAMLADPFSAFSRFTLGFDDLFRDLEAISVPTPTYPPYNLIRENDGRFRIEVAVAGFEENELDIQHKNGILKISSVRKSSDELAPEEEIHEMQVLAGIESGAYIHRGIARRDFVLQFKLSENIEIIGANLQLGMLTVSLATAKIDEDVQRIKIKAS